MWIKSSWNSHVTVTAIRMNLQVLEEYKGMCPVQAKVLFKWFRGYPSKYKLFQQACNRFRLGLEIEHKWYFCLTETQLQPSAESQSVLSLEELEMFYNSDGWIVVMDYNN